MKCKNLLKAVVFLLIFVILFCSISKVFTAPGDYRNYQWIAGFYEEPEDSLDAVYIGSSNCYAFWNPLVAWEKYGITVYPFNSNTQPIIAAEHLIKEVRKTQPDALFILNTNTLGEKMMTNVRYHYLLDYLPFSMNKLSLTQYLSEAAGLSFEDSLEFYFPIIRYHTRWDELSYQDFHYEVDGLKGASAYRLYLETAEDISKDYIITDETAAPPDFITEAFTSLLDYCDEEDVNILFVTVPRAEESELIAKQINALNQQITDRGYPVLDLMDQPEVMGANPIRDYYNIGHMNVHGSVKYTQYLSEYLIEHYGFEDKRGQAAYASWDEGWEAYSEVLSQSVLEFELDLTCRDFTISSPKNLKAKATKDGVQLSWNASQGAEQYVIYRKLSGGTWSSYAVTEALSFTDAHAQSGSRYVYRVVPACQRDGATYYGEFAYFGVTVDVD